MRPTLAGLLALLLVLPALWARDDKVNHGMAAVKPSSPTPFLV